MAPAAPTSHISIRSRLAHHLRASAFLRASIATFAILLTLALPACECKKPPAAAATSARVVPFSPGLALLVHDMGLGDRVVGRHAYDSATPGDIPPVGDEGGVDQEVMLRVAPNLVFIQRSAQGPPEFLARANDDGRFSLVVVPLLSLDDIPRAVRTIDQHVATFEHRAPSIDDPTSAAAMLVAKMERAFAAHPSRHTSVGRVLLLASANPPAAFGPGSWHHDLLIRVGATPAITEGGPYIAIDAEDVLRLNPDAIILVEAQDPDATPVHTRLGPLASLKVPAIANARLAAIDDPYIMTPSAAMIDFADRLDALLREWAAPE